MNGDSILDRGARDSKSRHWRHVRLAVIVLLVMFLLLLAAQWWFSTGIGRGVVESRLSAAFGRPVRLDGEFGVGIVPVPGASGTGLKVFTADGRWPIVEAGAFLARLSLPALLQGEVDILAVRLEDAGIDIGRLGSEPRTPREPAAPYFRIPDIRSFRLARVSVYFDGMGSQPQLNVSELAVDDFEVDAPAGFEVEATLISDGTGLGDVSAQGDLTLLALGVAEVNFSRLDVGMEGWAVTGIEGLLSADLNESVLDLRLGIPGPGQAFSLAGRLDWSPGYPEPVVGYVIESLELQSPAQVISGEGCWLKGLPPALHATLSAEAIDLDGLYALVSGWRQPEPAAAPRDTATPPEESDGESDLPFDVALRLEAGRATYREALAEGVTLRAGGEPNCPPVDDDG